jgi:hypothetical protein
MAQYESDHTAFMREWLEKNPAELKEKDAGMALWWNRPPHDPDTLQRAREAKVPAKSYYYDAN